VARARHSPRRIRDGCCARHWVSLFALLLYRLRCLTGSAG
jgi:hypothetical protein